MKFKTIKVDDYMFHDDFGSRKVRGVRVLVEQDFKSKSFNQKSDEHFLDDSEIVRLSRFSAQRFLDENNSAVLSGQKVLSAKEISGIKNVLGVDGTELGYLIKWDKGNVSKVLRGDLELQKDKAMHLLEILREELIHPGHTKILLKHLRDQQEKSVHIRELNYQAEDVAEVVIRYIRKRELSVTPLKLQKMLYYVQGVGYKNNLKVIKDNFVAWDYGPVIKKIYAKYKAYDSSELVADENADLSKLEQDDGFMAVVNQAISEYGVYDGLFLMKKSHDELPWQQTEKDKVIADDLMKRFFKKALL